MTSPLGFSEQNQIHAVDNALKDYIQQAQKSGSQNMNDLFNIEQQLSDLASNPKVPEQVRQNLQTALNELKQVQSGMNLSNLYTAKMQIDNALQMSESQGSEGSNDQLGGGSLGGGGGGEE